LFAVDHSVVYLQPVEEDDNTYINAVAVNVSNFSTSCDTSANIIFLLTVAN